MAEKFKILTVCTGNVCRSPLAQQLLELRLDEQGIFAVNSAGVRALVDEGMPEHSLEMARELGVSDPESHSAKQLDETLLLESDLILALDREHKKAIVELTPRVTKRVFTLREFARLADAITEPELAEEVVSSDPVQRLKQAVEAVGLGRGQLPPLQDPADADVIDPFGHSLKVYRRSTDEIVPAVDSTANVLLRALQPLGVG